MQETLSTLYFARRAKHIRNRATVNVDVRGDVTLLQKEIQRQVGVGCCAWDWGAHLVLLPQDLWDCGRERSHN